MPTSKSATIRSKVRRNYDARPYPSDDETALTKNRWRIAPLEWITALWRSTHDDVLPRRILVAGCGTGSEAFSLQRRLPAARIVAVDFSARSIAVARRLAQRAPEMRGIRFVVADLASPKLGTKVGRRFDLISCHGVLSYVPEPERALRNVARCLAPDGALYLGVNGATHASVGWRQVLTTFGFNVEDFRDSRHLREILRACDAMSFHRGKDRIFTKPPAYLASDIFCSFIHNLPLAEWLRVVRAAGLSLRGSYSFGSSLRPLCDENLTRVLMPRSREQICELEDMLVPASFHRLLLTQQPSASAPWTDPNALLAWRPIRTRLHETTLPARGRSWHALRTVRCTSAATNTRIDLRIPEWEVEILRKSDGTRPVRDMLGKIPAHIPARLLREQLYLLYLLIVINLLPPARDAASSQTA